MYPILSFACLPRLIGHSKNKHLWTNHLLSGDGGGGWYIYRGGGVGDPPGGGRREINSPWGKGARPYMFRHMEGGQNSVFIKNVSASGGGGGALPLIYSFIFNFCSF